ncbi:acidic repeat-containing protein-like isoform X2 [Biomphalaria pfeifferi]|uniref:Acidic repeat-containing protein-like isoform X2 n=1 Tax=Biomphalaria pfeifferi TaxID=112525 RepID=A0AAD8AY70_BIOPF|nr:acidic repeat-containing protein-like isoform X2 [Biomphalaria pfeifferi]
MDHGHEIDERNKNNENNCPKAFLHRKRITWTEFKSKKNLKQYIKNKDEQNLFDRLIKAMGNLTGLLTVKKNNISAPTDRIPGTCFLQGIRRRKTTEKGLKVQYAIFTFTTVYHLFAENVNDRYVVNKNWKTLDPKVVLFYTPNKSKDSRQMKITEMLEADKDYYVKNDWCAITCECYDVKLIADLENDLAEYQSLQQNLYLMSKEPAYQDIKLVIIVGHPHGGEKQVSIGRHFPDLKETLKDVRSGQRWCRYYYDAPTCPGNSGSPVFIFGQPVTGFGYWFGHPHNHAKEASSIKKIMEKCKTKPKKDPECIGMTSIGVEMIV